MLIIQKNADIFVKEGFRMLFTQSLKRNNQFGFVYNKGKSIANKYLVVYVIKNRKYHDSNRLGITVSKKVGKSVVRSRVTRLIKESYRLSEKDFKLGYDIVVLARVNSDTASYSEINKSMLSLFKKHNLIKEKA